MSGKQTAKDDEELTEEDYLIITTIVRRMLLLRNALMKRKPEDYAEKVFLKIGKSKMKPSIIRLLFDLMTEESNPIKSPDEFNQALAREILGRSVEDGAKDSTLVSGNHEHLQRYLHRPRMSEALRLLRDRGVLKHIEGKQAIRKEMHRPPGRVGSHSYDAFNERFLGKPSADVKSNNVKRISILLQNPVAQNIVYEALKETKILFEVERFMLSSFYFTLKKRKLTDEQKNILLVQIVRNATSSYGPIEDWQARSMYKQIYEQISKLNDSQIKQLAERKAKESTERRKDNVYFLAGLLA